MRPRREREAGVAIVDGGSESDAVDGVVTESRDSLRLHVATVGEQDALDGPDILPGYTLRVSAVFGPQPADVRSGEEQARS